MLRQHVGKSVECQITCHSTENMSKGLFTGPENCHKSTVWLGSLVQWQTCQLFEMSNFIRCFSKVARTCKLSPYGPRQANLVLNAYASSEGSGEPAHPRSLARTSAAPSYKQ